MDVKVYCFFAYLSFLAIIGDVEAEGILCEAGFCRTYQFEKGCTSPAPDCKINNATHRGLWMRSPTTCNCCDFCLPIYNKGADCSVGGVGSGTTVGRCGDGLTCVVSGDGHSSCERMDSECFRAQDDYDARHVKGEVGVLESRPVCNGKGRYGHYDCVPTQTCFCQSEEGKRIFGEVLNLGAATERSMHCGCSLLHQKLQVGINPGVGPRCTSDGNFNPVQCLGRICHCVDRITGKIVGKDRVNLDEKPLTELPCYDRTLDLFPSQNQGNPPYDYTTPCFERMTEKIEFLEQSIQDGFNVDFYNSVQECLPDGTFGRIANDRNGSRICVDQNGAQIDDYNASPDTSQYNDMDCKCAETSRLMESSTERPVCCQNGNFRTIQCRRGLCRCVDSDGRQQGRESEDVTSLPCYLPNWRDPGSTDCYSKP